jgi:ADP-heptose:LPS heptosyltransferase
MPNHLDANGIFRSNQRMSPFTPSRANINPPKRINRIRELLLTKSPKICVIRGEGIGDVIMALPSISALSKLFNNNLRLTFATNTRYLEGALPKVVQYNRDIDEIIDRNNIEELNFDAVLSLHCPAISYEVPMCKPINRIDLFADHLGLLPLKETLPKLFLSPDEISEGGLLLNSLTSRPVKENKEKKLLVQLFSSSKNRNIDWRQLRGALITLYNKHHIRSIIMSHPSDVHSDLVLSEIPGIVFIKDKDIRTIMGLMVHCDLVLCPDSSILHVAGSLQVPVVSIFGGTDPRARINYYPTASAIWPGGELNGHPHWYQTCPLNNLCYTKITEELIVNSCLEHISKYPKVNTNKLITSFNNEMSRTLRENQIVENINMELI